MNFAAAGLVKHPKTERQQAREWCQADCSRKPGDHNWQKLCHVHQFVTLCLRRVVRVSLWDVRIYSDEKPGEVYRILRALQNSARTKTRRCEVSGGQRLFWYAWIATLKQAELFGLGGFFIIRAAP